MTSIRIGVVGDLHTHWDDIDVAQFGRSDYDLLFFIGDLGGGTADSSLRIARSIARLDKETLVMPGNSPEQWVVAADLLGDDRLRHDPARDARWADTGCSLFVVEMTVEVP